MTSFHPVSIPRPSRFAVVAALACLWSTAASGWSITGTIKSSTGGALSGVSITVADTPSLKTTSATGGAFTLQHQTVGIESRDGVRKAAAWMEGGELVVQGLADGANELALVNVSGRSVWSAKAISVQGRARATLPTPLAHGAIFLRIRNAGGIEHMAVSNGASGISFQSAAGRAMAALPTLVFTLSGHDTVRYAMTSENMSGVEITMKETGGNCPLPTTYKWKDYGGPVASPKNGWASIKDFTHVYYNGKHYVHMTYYTTGWNAATMSFTDWATAKDAAQTSSSTGVAPELMYYTPKKVWINSKQWCSGGSFCWMESADLTRPSSFALKGNLLTETITDGGKAPIDHTLICDDDKCYIFYADDNGRIYRGSMPKANFPGTFKGTAKILQDTQARLFEAVQVYKVKGQKLYLMIVECMSPRYFRAFTATDLGGTWTSLVGADTQAKPFAGKNNVTGGWSDDISHGDLIRSTYDEYREIDPCNLQLMYQGYKPPFSGDYGKIPYQMGLLTHVK